MSGLLQNTRLGDYELIERIGEGGMADVYRAKQLTAFGREVALKVIRPDYTGDEPFRRRFLREARAISRLSHPNILPLIEFGRENGALFLVMPLVREGTLRDLLDTHRGPLTLEEALPFFLPLCDAVQYAHQEDIIHRDIKPQNILLQRHTHVLLADFGIARDLYDTRVTTVGAGIGSVEYMAPEQAEGRADVRSDIYSLGIVLYQLLTGVVPYSGTIPLEVLFKKAHEPLPNPLSYNPGLPADVVDILQIALSKDPGQRFEAAAALSNAAQQLSPCGMPPRLSRQISGLPGLDAPAAPDIDFASTIHARPRPPAPAVQEAWATRSFGSLPTELFSNAPATSQPLARRQDWSSDLESQTSPTRLSEEDEPPWGYRRDGVPPGSGSNPPSNHKYALLIAALIAALILTIGISSIAYGHLGLSWLHPDTANTGAQLLTPAPGITPRPTQPSGPPVTQPAPPSGPASTPTPQPTATPTPVPTDTPTPQPTATPAPTETPAPAPTDTPAPQPTVTPPPAPTQAPAPPSDNAPAPGANPAATP